MPELQANQQVNRVGKYLYKHIEGAEKIQFFGNTCDVYIRVLYQVPYWERIPGKEAEGYNDVKEMMIDVNITTYQNKLRVNVIEMSPEERTLGFDLYKPELLKELEPAKEMIWAKVIKRISTAYKDYDFTF